MQEIYSLRTTFSIIGITGRMGSGCTKFAELLSIPKDTFFSSDKDLYLRKPSSIIAEDKTSDVFRRKYAICYKFCQHNWLQYQVIDYKNALLLFCADYFKDRDNPVHDFASLLCNLFQKSKAHDEDFPALSLNNDELVDELTQLGLESIFDELKKIKKGLFDVKSDEDLDCLYNIFFKNNIFSKICNFIVSYLEKENYYLRTFLFHKLANNIRNTGMPANNGSPSDKSIYIVAKIINRLIKSYKKNNSSCHIAINSLKNSLEIMFFKERYSAFYIAAVHNDYRHKQRIQERVGDGLYSELTCQKLLDLDAIEYKSSSFSEGDFAAPDIENCIQKSEIHIDNTYSASEHDKSQAPDFVTLNEQIVKYKALIQQPGIITPSSVERCMQVAYTAKLTSGCISRQVGAVVADQYYTIKSIGWNDVPSGSIPCLLRNAGELIEQNNSMVDKAYSEFESTRESDFQYSENSNGKNTQYVGKTFVENLKILLDSDVVKVESKGKNCAFCFKEYHNKFEGEKNQVHTRSLHAEENAMIQVAKYGGQPLLGGILFTTASPCELCSKKAYQLGVKKIFYIDKYPGISTAHVLKNGYETPTLLAFRGAIGKSYNKLYEPFLSYKDELKLIAKRSD